MSGQRTTLIPLKLQPDSQFLAHWLGNEPPAYPLALFPNNQIRVATGTPAPLLALEP